MRKWFLFFGAIGLVGLVWLFHAIVPAPPRPATRAELQQLEARFHAVRDTLEELVLIYRHGIHLAEIRDSLFAAGDSLRVRELEREYDARLKRLGPLCPDPAGPGVGIISDSLMYIEAWARRGRGFDAPWSSAGYVYSNGSTKSPWFYKHLDGDWYLYSSPTGWGSD